MHLKVGDINEVRDVCSSYNTAKSLQTGGAEVYATIYMIGLMEKAAFLLLENSLDESLSSVGVEVNVSHISATPIGMSVRAVAKVLNIEEKRVEFLVEAYDEVAKIGEGKHVRYVINKEKFLKRTYQKLQK
ncbi:MAG: thioesterase family protein [Campylobacteraceae bacterium]